MFAILTSSRTLFDPRGRCNRRGLLYVSALLLAVQLCLGLLVVTTEAPIDAPAVLAVKLALLWTALTATAKRLHDCGRSAWWIVAAAFGLMSWCFVVTLAVVLIMGPSALAGEPAVLATVIVAVFLPLLALAIWLHCASGEAGANRFGAAPDTTGFSYPATLPAEESDDTALPAV